ncbi:hypothetical protein V8Z74_14665 [Comamonas sp. w2-DMI]|uniref:hypothetical protein n=1 Tax=Comamonas sp. w2-DMI TaxID=3126391 RepID=UPI0032E39532
MGDHYVNIRFVCVVTLARSEIGFHGAYGFFAETKFLLGWKNNQEGLKADEL